ncbi:MAG: signal peptide peptidase SppA [Thermodesulfobacteriota bacterium]|nr:signal peptide peptidase SppA [Thermodesulfobacteriota bacterium]
MFSRRHPYLFFILVFSSISAAAIAVVVISILVVVGTRNSGYDDLKTGGEKVGIIEIKGVISDSKDVIHHLKRFREDKSIRAIVLRIDSPGGGVGPSQEIFREIRKTVKLKKVVASMGAVAASGGYYIAAGADGIVANPGTITGSIGVIMGFTNFQQLFRKIGLVPVVVKSVEYKDMGSPVRDMTDDERKILQDLSVNIHRQFIEAISKGRKMELSKVESIADGRIFSGEQAKAMHLVDRLGNLEDAVEWAGRMAGIKGKVSYVYAPEKKTSLVKYLIESSAKEIADRCVNTELYAGYLYRP